MQITQSKTRDQFPLSTRKIWKKTTVYTFACTVILFFIGGLPLIELSIRGIFPFGALGAATIFLAAVIVMFIIIYWYQYRYFAVYYYDFTDSFVVIKKGVIASREITVPYERIQDVYVDQDVWDRVFGLYDVHLSSATFASGMEAHIDGVQKDAADGLKNVLLATIQQKIGRGKVAASTNAQ